MKLSSLLSPRKMMSHLRRQSRLQTDDLVDDLQHQTPSSISLFFVFVFQLTRRATADTRMRVRRGVRIRLLQSGLNLIRRIRIRRNFSRTQWDRREKSERKKSPNFDSDFRNHAIMPRKTAGSLTFQC